MPDPFVRPPRLWKRLLLGSLIVIVAAAAATAAAAFNELHGVVTALNRTPPPDLGRLLTAPGPDQPQTILLLGSDKRAGHAIDASSPPHTDTMMLVRIDPNQNAIAMMSIPRDLKVRIDPPGKPPYTGKINSAFSSGGDKLALQTVESLLGIPVNHLVNTNFGGFREAVDYLHCVYADVDHRYFNDNSGPQQYATINIAAGYQRLCGSDALDYVRYRHTDNDFVRVARQQDFLRQVKDQIGTSKLLSERRQLANIFGAATETDIHSTKAVLRLAELLVSSGGHAIRQVHFRANIGPSYVTASPDQINQSVRDFLGQTQTSPPKPPRQSSGGGGSHRSGAGGLQQDPLDAELAARNLAVTGLPVYYPTLVAQAATYSADSRSYEVPDQGGQLHRAYRIVVQMGAPGDYYGIQGIAWTNPPILANPNAHQTIGGRAFDLYYSGSRLRLVAWRVGGDVYWVSNDLLQTLSDQQMLALASSTRALSG